jgi:Protein of unknown function (DUF3892)
MSHQITCITKPDRESSHEAIQRVGGIAEGGQRFNVTRVECYDYIKSGHKFHVVVDRYDVNVEAYERNGGKFVRTYPDATKKDNLLSLPECRWYHATARCAAYKREYFQRSWSRSAPTETIELPDEPSCRIALIGETHEMPKLRTADSEVDLKHGPIGNQVFGPLMNGFTAVCPRCQAVLGVMNDPNATAKKVVEALTKARRENSTITAPFYSLHLQLSAQTRCLRIWPTMTIPTPADFASQPLNAQRAMLANAIGECLMSWAAVERQLHHAFVHELVRQSRNKNRWVVAKSIWSTIISFEARLRMIDGAINANLHMNNSKRAVRLKKDWRLLYNYIGRMSGLRNEIAHGEMMNFDDKEMKIAPYSTTIPFRGGIPIQEVINRTNSFAELSLAISWLHSSCLARWKTSSGRGRLMPTPAHNLILQLRKIARDQKGRSKKGKRRPSHQKRRVRR